MKKVEIDVSNNKLLIVKDGNVTAFNPPVVLVNKLLFG